MTQRKNLTDANVADLPVTGKKYDVYDVRVPNFCVRIEASGLKTFYFIYSFLGQTRNYRIGPQAMGASEARIEAKKLTGDVARGIDPQAEKSAKRGGHTFGEVADRYRDEHAKVFNKSWKQAAKLVDKHLRPHWAKLPVASISRSDVKAMMARITPAAPIVANSTLAAASAIFRWCIKEEIGGVTASPCSGVDQNETNDRERVLSDAELPMFWREFDEIAEGAGLKLLLLLGQRPGEIARMHTTHLIDGWWSMPGEEIEELRWNGTKNSQSHRIWLSKPAREIIAAQCASGTVFTGPLGGLMDLEKGMQEVCERLRAKGIKVERATPHDLRRTCGTMIVRLTKSETTMDRILNHREKAKDRKGRKTKKKTARVYNLYKFEAENQRAMEDVAAAFMRLVGGQQEEKVVALRG
jgi:integrase